MSEKKYIEVGEAEKFLRALADKKLILTGAEYANGICYAACHIADVPAANVRPVVPGRWVHPVPGDGEVYCSACKRNAPWFYGYGTYEPDICPHCGAIMT